MTEIFLFCGIFPVFLFSKILVRFVLYIFKYLFGRQDQKKQKRNNSNIQEGYVAFMTEFLCLIFLHDVTNFQLTFHLKKSFKATSKAASSVEVKFMKSNKNQKQNKTKVRDSCFKEYHDRGYKETLYEQSLTIIHHSVLKCPLPHLVLSTIRDKTSDQPKFIWPLYQFVCSSASPFIYF